MRNRVATRGGDDNRNRPHILRPLRPARMPKASIILVVCQQLLVRSSGDTEKLDLCLERGLDVGVAFDDILLCGTRGLRHLIDGAVAVFRKKPATENDCQLIQDLAALIEIELFKNGRLAQNARPPVAVV